MRIVHLEAGQPDAATAASHGSWTVLSGPAGGAVGAARSSDASDCVGLDMGGTSCDVSVSIDGRVAVGGGRDSVLASVSHALLTGSEIELDLEASPGSVKAGTEVRRGDPVVTQGYQGGVFPAGLPIGVVERVDPAGAASLVPRVAVRPYAALGTLDVVAVLVDRPARPARGS